jgi:soluble lytic murein transglycosylase
MSHRILAVSLLSFAMSSLQSGVAAAPSATARTSALSGAAVGAPEQPLHSQPSAELVAIRSFFADYNGGLLAPEVDEVAGTILRECRRTGLDPNVVLALIAVESSGNPAAISHADARGLMQLRPATARAESEHLGLLWKGSGTLFDPVLNVRLGISYLSRLVERFGDLETALVAYNWGPTRIARSVRRGLRLPVRYRHRVLSELAMLQTPA